MLISKRTKTALKFDILRLRARLKNQIALRKRTPSYPYLHFGCGKKIVPHWVNVDVVGSPFDIDLASPLPWKDESFEVILSQQVIEHLDLQTELLVLMAELHRVAKKNCEIWLSCPDMSKVCHGYVCDRGAKLLEDRQTRFPVDWHGSMPSQQIINELFHQSGQHRNLFDFEFLCWILTRSGFGAAELMTEADLLRRFPVFPPRGDDQVAIYVRASKA